MRNKDFLKVLTIIIIITVFLTGCSKNESQEALGPVTNESQEVTTSESPQIEEVAKEIDEIVEELIKEPNIEPTKEPVTVEVVEPVVVVEPDKKPEAPEDEVVDVKENALKIEGKVGNEVAFTLDELKGMSDIIFEGKYYSLNSYGTTKYNIFKGVNLWNLLESKAQILPDTLTISLIASDGYQIDFTVEQVKKQDYIDETNPEVKLPMIIAWEQDGDEYSLEEGAPFKLIVGQKEAGDINKPQWVSNIDKIIVE